MHPVAEIDELLAEAGKQASPKKTAAMEARLKDVEAAIRRLRLAMKKWAAEPRKNRGQLGNVANEAEQIRRAGQTMLAMTKMWRS